MLPPRSLVSLFVAAALLVMACPPVLAGETTSAASGEQPIPPSVLEPLNLDFEASDRPEGWFAGGEGYVGAIDEDQRHTGERSLRLEYREPGQFGVATNRFPVEAARGKRLRFSGFLRTKEITTGWAGLWMRVDGPEGILAFDNMQARGIRGTTDWTRHEIVLDVPEEAVNINFGALLTGNGVAWVDSLAFEIAGPLAPPPIVRVTGVVTGPDDAPVAGALVALVRASSDRATVRARTDPAGRFSLEVRAGEYGTTVTARGLAAAYLPPAAIEPGAEVVERDVKLGKRGFTLRGLVADDRGKAVPGAIVRVIRLSEDLADIFYTEADDRGRYELSPPPGDGFVLEADSEKHVTMPVRAAGTGDQTLDITMVRIGPMPDEVVAWIRNAAVPLATVEAGHGFEDMRPLKEIVGDARVVALGEATHGSREFFQLKHRLLEFLVREMGFTVFAIEANWPECLAINDYVLEGEGDPKEALKGIYFWTWDTQEVLEQIEWIRRYNADPAHERKVRFYGFDMQAPGVAARQAIAYVNGVDASYGKSVASRLEPFLSETAASDLSSASKENREALEEALREVLRRFDSSRDPWIEATGEREWELAKRKVVLLRQALGMFAGGEFNARDAAMAANVEWILDTEPPGTRVVVWAHNGHVSRSEETGMKPMGSNLARSLGEDYVALGFVFYRGSFQAIDWTEGRNAGKGLIAHTVGPAPEGYWGEGFARTDLPVFALDLRRLPAEGPVAGWFRVPHPMRETGAVFVSEERMSHPVVLTDHYDGILFVRETTRARPVER